MSKFSDIPRELQLILEQLKSIVIRDILLENERRLLVKMLYNWKKVIAFNFLHYIQIIKDVVPL
jgi:hypothetical protein